MNMKINTHMHTHTIALLYSVNKYRICREQYFIIYAINTNFIESRKYLNKQCELYNINTKEMKIDACSNPSNFPESSLKMYLNIIVQICLVINQKHSALMCYARLTRFQIVLIA